jgi:uncharacterized protein (DUF2252 family)
MNSVASPPQGAAWSLRTRREPKAARAEAGRQRRDAVPLDAHADLARPADRASALSILQAEDTGRVPNLVPIRYGRMLATPFTFLRGSAAVMAADLAVGPRTDLDVQLCGDAHLSNFGVFSSPERRLVFDVNDFDETLPGPFEWDVKRLAASVVVAGRNNKFQPKPTRQTARATVAAYRSTLKVAAAADPLELFYYQIDFDDLTKALAVEKRTRRELGKARKKAGRKNSLGALAKLTDIVDGRRVIVPKPPLIVPLDDEQRHDEIARIETFFDDYRATLDADRQRLLDRYSLIDLALKVVGIGSVGTRCLVALFESGGGEPLFLQIKEAGPSVLEPHLEPTSYDQAGHRVVAGQRITQAAPDALLGWARYQGGDEPAIDFYVRQLWDGKLSAEVETMTPDVLRRYAAACASALALAHARSGDASMIDGYLGEDDTFDRAITKFAEAYADRTEQDYAELHTAAEDGRIPIVDDI